MLTIHKPLVNGLRAPLGLDVSFPRFSWQLTGTERGEQSIAYGVKVAASKEGLQSGAVLWDSGQRIGNQLHLTYEGPPLIGNMRYWWQASVWDSQGNCIEMTPECWETGLFPGDWQAQWIWRSDNMQINDFAYFRHTFELATPVVRAKLYVSAHHLFQLYVNGQRIGGYGSPAPTGVPNCKYYLAYDVTDALLDGVNCMGATAHYLGGSGQNYVNGVPGFLLQLHIENTDGEQLLVKSDRTWQTLRSVPHRIGTPYQQNRRLSAIEDYDASKLDPSWLQPEYSEEHCQPAVLADATIQQWQLKWQQIREGKEIELIVPSPVTKPFIDSDEDLVQLFDTGTIISGWPRIALPSLAGVTIQLRYSESLNDQGWVSHQVCNEQSSHYYDRYTMHGRGGTEIWSPDFSYKAFRYIEVTGYPHPLEAEQLTICSLSTGIAEEGYFHCSSEPLNKLFQVSLQTQRNNTLGQIVDCPHREQAQYLADTDLQAETLLYNFDAYSILDKTLQDFADGQLDDGTFPFVFPSNYEHPDFYIQIPEWDLHFATLLWKLYQSSGDEQLLERHYESMRAMIDAYMSTLSPDTGLIPIGRGWHISDWPYPTIEHKGEHLTVQQIKAWQALRITSEAAAILGYASDSETYASQAAALQTAILAHLYDPSTGKLRDSSDSTAAHQGVGALALYAGLLTGEDHKAVLAGVTDRPWECKTVLSLPLLRVLFENGYQALAYHLLSKQDYPGWGYMIAQGATTMWEGWDDIESHCHAWNGYPARLLQEYIVGIQSVTTGFATTLIRPYFAADLTFAEAVVPTVRGAVSVRWERLTETTILVRLALPCMISAHVKLDSPASRPIRRITENGETLWDNHSPTIHATANCRLSSELLELDLLSGQYEITLHY
ncbi:MAG: family 78 glycoside hydrolase catalytic domain [Candidatus Pristimantibacillus sp.]